MSTLSIPAARGNGLNAFIKRNPLISMYLIRFALILIAIARGKPGQSVKNSGSTVFSGNLF